MLAIAFGYIEAAVVVYLRQIFHPAGFVFPLTQFPLMSDSNHLLLVEVAREAATLVLIIASAWVAGKNIRQRLAFFLIIFAVWDIFYYVFLKLLLGWPASVMDWDVLFLIPLPWAGPVLAPVIVSVIMLVFAALILYRDWMAAPIKATSWDWFAFSLAALIVVISFCIAGQYMSRPAYNDYFSWPLFIGGMLPAIALLAKYLYSQDKALQ
jgi:hypothetical protein